MTTEHHRTLAIASDHRGHDVIDAIRDHLTGAGWEVDILARPDDRDAAVDYPDAARAVANAIVDGRAERGVLVCGSGIGMSMAANRVQGIRAALVADTHAAEMSRRHNDANVLCMGSSCLEPEAMNAILDVWLATAFEGGRHVRRVDKIDAMDSCEGSR